MVEFPPVRDLADILGEAAEHHSAGRLSAAASLYDEILAVSPDRADILHLRGGIAIQNGDPQRAIALIGRAIALEGAIPGFHNSLGLALRDTGAYREAAVSFRRALALNGDFPEALFNLGGVQYAAGDVDVAGDTLRRALDKRRDYAEALAALGCIAFERQAFREARRRFRRAARINPEFAFGRVCHVGRDFRRHAGIAGLDRRLARAPEVDGERPRAGGDGPLVTTACDPVYFRRFGKTLARSLDRNAPGNDLHFHITNPDAALRGEFDALRAELSETRLTASWEAYPEADRFYYSNMRFVRLYQLAAAVGRDTLSLDTDSLVLGELDGLTEAVAGGDLAVLTRPHRPEIHQKILATTIHVGQTAPARTFLAHMAAYMLDCLRRGRLVWSLDQCAFYIAWKMMEFSGAGPAVTPLPARFADHAFDSASAIWAAKGSREIHPAFADQVAKYA